MIYIAKPVNWGGKNVVWAGAIVEDSLEEELDVLQLGSGDQYRLEGQREVRQEVVIVVGPGEKG